MVRPARLIGISMGALLAITVGSPVTGQEPATNVAPINYPRTKATDVVDDYHGRKVSDPFRWLEDTESKQTAAWIEAQNKVTNRYLESIPEREQMRKRLEQLLNYERFGLPDRHGSVYFYSHNDGLQDQSVYYKSESLDAPRSVLLDPNELSEDGTVALAGTVPSEDGKLLAYGLADGGSDWRTWKIRDVATGKDLDDLVQWVKFSGIAWLPDSSGFFYGRYNEPTESEVLTGTNENQQLYFHKLGDDQSKDRLILARPDYPKWGFSPSVTDDGRYLIIQVWKGSEPKAQIFVKDLSDPDSEVQELITGFDAEYEWVGSIGDKLYFVTDNQAPKRRLIAVTVGDTDRGNWQEVIGETGDVLQSVSLFGETIYATWLKDARGKVTRHQIDGTQIDQLELPGVGTVSGFGGPQDAEETFFSFTNYVTPSTIYRVDLESGRTSLWRQPEIDLDISQFVTEQLFCKSKDGTTVPIIVTRKKDTKLDGSNRTLL